ncbi:membrane protein insertion efficiency factor YidD [Nesterenkonia ebinurensis]|uniref:membrane protein insertion efficiency factor YidD n=1 Tax=Nesterenkonia ebinurensis TaxID=2608252 RepID=UPI001CC68E7C|nr:membrane protein insertion efficiency factor YidD [Nesterenkonia ebinurensis]
MTTWVRHRDFYAEEHDDTPEQGHMSCESNESATSGEKSGASRRRRASAGGRCSRVAVVPATSGSERGAYPPPDPAKYWKLWRRAASYPLVLFISLWRRLISPLYGNVCSFYPSCSAYGLEAVTVHGLFRGSGLTAWRILRCNPFSGGGVDHVPPSERTWPYNEVPEIIRLNHPPIPPDED